MICLHSIRVLLTGASRRWLAIPRWLVPYAMLLPAALLLVLLNFATSLFGVYISFLDWNYLRTERMFEVVGLKHYYELFQDPRFYNSLKVTAVWSVFTVPCAFAIGLGLALLLNEDIRAKPLFRSMILVPWATPLVVAAVAWSVIFAAGIGPLNDLFVHLGMPEMKYMNWMSDRRFAFPILMGVQIWRWAPFFAITLLAGLQGIPSEIYDAAEIDGAGTVQRFLHLTLPLLRPVASVVLLQVFIWSIHSFTIVFIMTGGGPANATELTTIYLWRAAFKSAQTGTGSAVGTILMLPIAILGIIWLRRAVAPETAE